jgi:hypothetical protein
MDDERLLSEALRAHAAGGVSSPGSGPAAPTPGAPAPSDTASGSARLRDRFRPLGRRRGADTPDAEDVTALSARPSATPPFPAATRGAPPPGTRPGPPAPTGPAPTGPAPAGPARPWPQTGARPTSRPPVPPTGPMGRPGVPQQRPAPVTGATTVTPTGAGRPVADQGGATEWTPARIAWWSAVALLGGAIAGALTAVGTLALPG